LRRAADDDRDRLERQLCLTCRLGGVGLLGLGRLGGGLAQARQYADQIVDDLRQFNAILDQAIADRGAGEQSVVVFSQLKGAIPFIERQLDPFIKIGEGVLRTIANGRLDDARTLSLEFTKTEAAFGSDTAALRDKLADLTKAGSWSRDCN
jgi:hypothetical protein